MMQPSISDDFEVTQVRIKLVDPMGRPISQLRFQIKQGARTVSNGVTDEQGKLPPFSSRIGAPLSVHVEHFLTKDMKCIRELTPWTEIFSVVLVSGKIKEKATLTPDNGEPGTYRRKTHVVQPGDTLSAIARKHGYTAQELARFNDMKLEAIIRPGQIIKIPTSAAAPTDGTSSVNSPQTASPAQPAPAGNSASVAPTGRKTGTDPTKNKPSPSSSLQKTGTSENRGENGTPKTTASLTCPGACIKLGDKGPLIEEVNIRLTGFGGTIHPTAPLDEFTPATEKAIKQFQRDFMGVAETGKICGSLLIALDEFRSKIPVDFSSMKCRCGHCNGFGNGLTDSTKANMFSDKNKTIPFNGIEYPGIHRALPWVLRASIYYAEHIDKASGFKFLTISSGYRCWHDNAIHKRDSTNHMGNALDIQFTRHDAKSRCSGNDVDTLRSEIFIKRLGAQLGWITKNKLSLETSKQGAKSWVHVDVREYEQQHKNYRFYAIAQTGADGDTLAEMARREGKLALISCGGLPPKNATPTPPADLAQTDKRNRIDVQSLSISKEGITFIKGWERCSLQPYDDSEGFCTIGWGRLIKKSSCEAIRNDEDFKQYKQGISQTVADDFLIEDIKRMENIIKSRIQAPLFQHEYDALVSLVFNMGSLKKCPKLLSKLNTKDYNGCCDEFSDITNNGAPGLIKRRQSEMNLFRNNLYDSTH